LPGSADILSDVPGASSRLRLRVAPGGRRSAVVGRYGEAWKVRVAAAPERGRANDEVIAVIADALDISRAAVRLVAGAASRDKIVELEGMDADEADRRLQRVAQPLEDGEA
jgi:uncharacterized protein YggU (UPF0235/DUF167 family)